MFLDSDEEREEGNESTKMRPMMVEIDLDLSAMANARRCVFVICKVICRSLSQPFPYRSILEFIATDV